MIATGRLTRRLNACRTGQASPAPPRAVPPAPACAAAAVRFLRQGPAQSPPRPATAATTTGAWGPCVGAVLPAAETCDSLDNDCDGATDEGLAGDSYETNETCARARSLPRADEGFATDPLIEVTAATLLHTDGSADVDWFTISANEASHLDCGLPWEVLPQCYFYLEIHLAPPLGMDRTPWRMCVHEGGCSVGTEHCTSAADWNPTAGAYVMILPWQGTCWLDDEWTFYVRVDATSAGVRSCRPYALRYRFYFSGGAGTAFCS
jgi:hypothetical protein